MKKSPEQSIVSKIERPSTEQERRVRAIARYIEKRVIGMNKSAGEDEEQELREYYKRFTPRERADILYGKLMAYIVDKQAEAERKKKTEDEEEKEEQKEPDPLFIGEIKVLFNDSAARDVFLETYGEARVDAKKLRVSELVNCWRTVVEDIQRKEKIYRHLEQELYLNKISGKGAISSAASRMERLADNFVAMEKQKEEVETLLGFPKIVDNTDAVANFQYENLREYKRQLDEGFVWLPSRKAIHRRTVGAILNHRWPVLIGEAGSGKSDQADAAALELTGHLPTHVPCSSKTGEAELIRDMAIDKETGGSYEKYGELFRAFTGYDDSRQEKPSVETGRIVRLDEAYRIPHESSGYSILKEARQVKTGDLFYGKQVLPGAGAIWTTNPPGPRYPGRTAPDAAMRREVAEIKVDYPEMSVENPELYEFALTALMDENNHISVAKEELSPVYEKKEIPEDKREVLEDGSIVVAEDKIINNMSDKRHGALWRFCSAVKALQDGFVYGNTETEKYPDTLLRFKEDADGNIEMTSDGSGEPLTFSTSTATLGELASWMKGFNERWRKRGKEFHVDTLTEWLNFKIDTYLEQADKSDKEKLRALFKHFGFFDKAAIPDLADATPLTPKKIGYLSPRVPRPVYVEKPIAKGVAEASAERKSEEAKKYETRQVLLEDGSRILMKIREYALPEAVFDLETKQLVSLKITIGTKFKTENESFIFAGVVEDASSPFNGQAIGQLASGEKLFRIFTKEGVDWGIVDEFEDRINLKISSLSEECKNFWSSECVKNAKNNPKKIQAPVW